jgi:hypothetical protein
MASTRIVFNDAAFRAILHSDAVTQILEQEGQMIAERANSQVTNRVNTEAEPFVAASHQMGSRAIVNVYTRTFDGQRSEAYHRTLTRSVQPHG